MSDPDGVPSVGGGRLGDRRRRTGGRPPGLRLTCVDHPEDEWVWISNFSCDFCIFDAIPWPRRGILLAWEGLKVRRQICGSWLQSSEWSWAECGFCVP